MFNTLQYNFKYKLIFMFRARTEPPGTTVTQIRRAQQLYLSAFHPDTGELQNVIGRMSFQVPGGMVLIGAMITFYRFSLIGKYDQKLMFKQSTF